MDYNEPAEDGQISAADLGSFGVVTAGNLLGTTFRAISANGPPLFLIALVLVVPFNVLEHFTKGLLVLGGMVTYFGDLPGLVLFSLLNFLVMVLGFLGIFVMQAAVILAVLQHMAGREVSIRDAIAKSLSKLVPLLVASLLVGIAVTLGLILCVVPGVILMLLFFLTTPAIVAEDLGPIQAMRRSAQLTEGNKIILFSGLLVFWALSLAGNGIAFVLSHAGATAASVVASTIVGIVGAMVYAVYSAVAYARLRGMREGMDVDEIIEVFA